MGLIDALSRVSGAAGKSAPALLLALLVASPGVFSVVPNFLTDSQLADSAVIVVAHWPKSKIEPHHKIAGDVCTKIESHTTLVVDRVIKGNIKAGPQPLLLSTGIAWQEDGRGLESGTSTSVHGAVEDVIRPAIWFLSPGKSWKAGDRTVYLVPDTYRCIQPLNLETFYRALLTGNRPKAVAALLTSADKDVALHALEFLNGEELPWPANHKLIEFVRGKPGGDRGFPEYRDDIAATLSHPSPEVRAFGAAVYAHLAGRQSIERLRPLLGDEDESVRATTIALLSRFKDGASLGAMSKAVSGLKNSRYCMEAVESLHEWHDVRVVPILIRFLDVTNNFGLVGTTVYTPALSAQEALQDICHSAFPFDSQRSLKAWESARDLPERQRSLALSKMLSTTTNPLSAVVTKFEEGSSKPLAVQVQFTNTSKKPLEVSSAPHINIEYGRPSGASVFFGGKMIAPTAPSGFLTLAPHESIEVKIEGAMVPGSHSAGPGHRTVQIFFLRINPLKRRGVERWIGIVRAR